MTNSKDNSQLKTMFIGLLIVFLLFLLFAIYKRKDILYNSEGEGFTNKQKNIAFRLFYTDWCPHCTSTKPEWEKLQANWNMAKREMYWENNRLNYQDIKIEKINCEKDKAICKEFDVQGYPTIVLSIGDKNIEYTGEARTHTELIRFLETKLLEYGVSYK